LVICGLVVAAFGIGLLMGSWIQLLYQERRLHGEMQLWRVLRERSTKADETLFILPRHNAKGL